VYAFQRGPQLLTAAGRWSNTEVNAAGRPRRYVLRAIGFFAVAVAGIVMGTVASAHHMDVLNGLAVGIVGISLGLAIAMLSRAYMTEVRIPARTRPLIAMSQAMGAGQAVSGEFKAGLREVTPGVPRTRWKHGRVKITPRSVVWVHLTGRARDLTGAQCTGSRQMDPTYTEMTLSLPSYYKGEDVRVMTLHAGGTDIELAAPARLLEIIRYSLGDTR
jgi:hypothetical protein